MAAERVQRRLAAILVADVVGYSRAMEADEEGTRVRLRSLHADLIDPRIAADGGRIVKTSGDGILVEFASAVDAVRNALDIQAVMRRRNADLSDARKIEFRVGINIGDVIVEGDDIHGDGVNVASRLEGLCEPGEVYVSGAVFDQAEGKVAAVFDDLGEHEVKNIAKPVRTYRARARSEETADTADTAESVPVPAPVPDKPSIAVLPFDNMSGDPEQEYFSDGISEDLITALSRIRHFNVIARNSTFFYKGTSPDIRQVSNELGARYIVEGSVRKSGSRVRVSAQLIDGTTGNHVWAKRYDRDLEDIFTVQDELTLTLVGAIEPEMNKSERERAVMNRAENLDAWELYHRGMWHMSRQTPEDLRAASSLFHEAMERDEKFAPAHAAYAQCYFRNRLLGTDEGDGDRALISARRAIELDPSDPMGHQSFGFMLLLNREHGQAVAEFETATSINPSSAHSHHFLGTALIHAGRADAAMPHLLEAIRLSPADPDLTLFNSRIGWAHFFLGDDEAAVQWTEKAIRLPGANWPMRAIRLAALARLGRDDDASEALAELLRFRPDITVSFVRKRLPTADEAYRESLFDGLRKAGLPEGD